MLKQGIVLKNKTDLAFSYMAPGGILSVEKNRPAFGRFESGDNPQQRCLAGT